MTTSTDYGECFLTTFPHVHIKTVLQRYFNKEHLYNDDGSLKEHISNIQEENYNHGGTGFKCFCPTLFVTLEYKMDGCPYMITKEYCLYEDAESLKELEQIKDNIFNQDPSEEIEGETLDLINAFHNGYGCECLDHD
tara:strand:+ start:1947 stop:2357 length:411 start_codon:yes stop_codon:yes gene_type:complete